MQTKEFLVLVLVCQSSIYAGGLRNDNKNKMTDITCELITTKTLVLGQSVKIETILSNNTIEDIQLLQYYTPYEGILGDIFSIQYKDSELSYQGPLVKRGPPTDADWLNIEPNSHLASHVDLNLAWDFNQPGWYEIKLRNSINIRQHNDMAESIIIPLDCPSILIEIVR